MFRTVPLSIIKTFSLHTQQYVYVIQLYDMTYVYDIYLLLCVQWKPPDDGHKNCPKLVEIYFIINQQMHLHKITH